MLKFHQLREQFPLFIYHGYDLTEDVQAWRVSYHFEIPGLSRFDPAWSFPKKNSRLADLRGNGTVEKLLFSLGMVELISYWKLTCSPQVLVRIGALNEAQIRFWK